MSKPKVVVTEREVRMARAFLAALGGNQTNGYLLLAIIAWQRLQKKAKDPFWKKLAGMSSTTAGRALAAHLKALAAKHPSQYRGLLKAIRLHPGSAGGQAGQAKSFMLIIEKSGYDHNHYGYKAATEGKWVLTPYGITPDGVKYGGNYVWVPGTPEVDPMLQQWAALTGHPIPPKWFVDAGKTLITPKPEKPLPRQPRGLEHVLPKPEYILPYAALHFYEERPHMGENILPGD